MANSQATLLLYMVAGVLCRRLKIFNDGNQQNFIDLLGKALKRVFGPGVKLTYRVVTDQENQLSQDIEADPSDAIKQVARTRANQSPSVLDAAAPEEVPTNLKPQYNFDNYLEGESNKLCYNIGRRVAEHPNGTQFNPMFIFGPSGSGKTHLLNAIGLKTLELYPKKRVLYVSARLFQTQYTDAVLHNTTNDFINFYQTIDMLLIDDIQEWEGKTKTLNTFFHIFNHLFRNGKRILLACDRPPVELRDMPERLISRFAGGLVAQLDKPNVELCADIIRMKMRRDGLDIPEDVVILASDIIEFAKVYLDVDLNPNACITLADHIAFSIQRVRDGLSIDTPLAFDVRHFYPKETRVGKRAVTLVKTRLGVELPDAEVTNIALHIIDAEAEQGDLRQTKITAEVVADVVGIVESCFGSKLDTESFNYARFVTRFLVGRIEGHDGHENKLAPMLDVVKGSYPESYACVLRIVEYFSERWG